MAAMELTVTVVVFAQPLPIVYDIREIPLAALVTIPVEPIVATDVFVLLHVPLEVASLSVIVLP